MPYKCYRIQRCCRNLSNTKQANNAIDALGRAQDPDLMPFEDVANLTSYVQIKYFGCCAYSQGARSRVADVV
jgi:hypothetical protein